MANRHEKLSAALQKYLGRMVWGVFLATLLSGCGTINSIKNMVFSPSPASPSWESFLITASDDVNQNSPIAMDLVFVSDTGVLDALLATPSAKWFASRNDMQKSFPGALTVLSYELIPRQSVKIDEKSLSGYKGFSAIVYADYPGQAENRERLGLKGDGYHVLLGSKSFKVTEIKAP